MTNTLNQTEINALENAINNGTFFTTKKDIKLKFADGERGTEQGITVYNNLISITRQDIGYFGAPNYFMVREKQVNTLKEAILIIEKAMKKNIIKG